MLDMMNEAVAQAIVDRIASGRRVARVEKIPMGEIGAVYAIEFADAGPGYVLKAYPANLRWKMRKDEAVLALVQDRLSVPVPRIVSIDDEHLVMTRLAGSGLLAMEEGLAPAQVVSAYEQMGRAMREIHRIEMAAFGYLGADGIVQPAASNRAYMQGQLERKLAGFAQFGGDAGLARRLQSYVADRLALLDGCTSPRLLHYDFHTGNILAERHGDTIALTGLLDWENAIAADPLMDLAKTLAYSVRGDRTKHAALLAGYGAIDRPRWRETIALYEFYGLIELWAWWMQTGDHTRARTLLPDLARFVST